MTMSASIWALLALCATQGVTSAVQPRQSTSNTAVVDLSVKTGNPQHLAAGFIYGIPDTLNQIPDSFYQDFGFKYGRFGGAQLSQGGWIYGLNAYYARLNSTYNNYITARKYGAKVILLPHDLWGTDHANSSTVWPGDNGNWTDYDNFLNQLIGDLKRLNMLGGLVYDIWNEPDGSFWARSEAQFLQLYVRTHRRLRQDSTLNNVLISGPASASQPSTSNTWWTSWLQTVVQNQTIPDQYSWHDEPGDPAVDMANLKPLLAQYNAPSRTVNINEYATFDQQNSVGAAWFISRLERYNALGLRGNWLSSCQLRDFMASLLGKANENSCTSASGYFPNGEFQVYKYYNRNMTGVRAQTTSSGDGVLDVYTTIGSSTVRTLTGCMQVGTWYIQIKNLSAVGLPTSGSLTIQTWGFDDAGHMGQVNGPSNRGTYAHTYSGNSVTFPVYQTNQDQYTAWGFEFNVGSS